MRRVIQIVVLSCVFILKTHGQLGFCNGNSGDPIFTEDFGTGTSNTSLAPGTTTYNFIGGFPDDGEYTVSNGSFGNAFDWHQMEDRTPGDVNGKCMIVNAGFSAGEFYRTTVSGLCETTTYEFSAWLVNLVIAGSFCSTQPSGTIPINVSFEIWDSTDTNLLANGNTGNIFESSSPNWQEYGLVFQTLIGQNEVILKMINNGVGGCGNDLAIDDIEFKSCGDTIIVRDAFNNSFVSICSGETPYTTSITAMPDNSVFSDHFYQWQVSTDATVWNDIVGEANQTLNLFGIAATSYYRAKVAEFASNLINLDCITYSDIFQITVNQAPPPPTIDCWETATLNNTTCTWDITGTQPAAPTGLACWETATFNSTTCVWDIVGTQPIGPSGLACWETATFNNTTCVWDITGTQPVAPTGLACWETATFNNTTCTWDIVGTQPIGPSGLACWETATFNNTSCTWDITGTQPVAPTGLACWESTTFNNTTCVWDITGTQPPAPTGFACWETATLNNTTCTWNITGTQPTAPSGLACWETATFNNTTCIWDITGMQPAIPTGLACWESTTFNNTTCVWDIIGTQPAAPTGLACWETATFINMSCLWEIHGEEPIDSIEEFVILCEGEIITLDANTGIINPTYLWSTGEITEEIMISNSGTYTVEITDNSCFTIIKTIYVTQYESPQIASIFSEGNTIIVEMLNIGDFEYSLDGIQYQSNNIFFNIEGGFYTVYVKELNNCGIITANHLHFVIPLFFTPNNDGIHDTFDLKGIENYNTSEVYIFNRYGKLLKSSYNQPFVWDGTFNNQVLPNSDYWYIIKIDSRVFKGHFTLKR